jgi:hypothetical protein
MINPGDLVKVKFAQEWSTNIGLFEGRVFHGHDICLCIGVIGGPRASKPRDRTRVIVIFIVSNKNGTRLAWNWITEIHRV